MCCCRCKSCWVRFYIKKSGLMRLNFACREFSMKLSSLEFDDGNKRKLLEILSEFAKFWRVQACKELLDCINQCLLQEVCQKWKVFLENLTTLWCNCKRLCRDDVLINIIRKLNRCVLSGMENWTVCAVLLLASNRFMYDGVHCLAEFPSQAYWNAFTKFIVDKIFAAFNPEHSIDVLCAGIFRPLFRTKIVAEMEFAFEFFSVNSRNL